MTALAPCRHCWDGTLPGINATPMRCPFCGGHGRIVRRYDIRIVPRQVLDGYRASIYERDEEYGMLLWMDVFETRDQAQFEADRQRVLLEGTGTRV